MGGDNSKPTPPPAHAASKSAPKHPPQSPPGKKMVGSPATPVVVKRRVPTQSTNPTDTAILELKLQRERLHKLTAKYSNLADKLKAAAVDVMKTQSTTDPERAKKNALALIHRSKQHERQLESCSNTLMNVETSLNALEDGLVQVEVMRALEGGAKALDTINAELSRADEVMENVREAVAQEREITEILASTAGMADVSAPDDDELEAELNKIMGVAPKQKQPAKTTAADQVVVPNHSLPDPAKQQVDAAVAKAEKEEEDADDAGPQLAAA